MARAERGDDARDAPDDEAQRDGEAQIDVRLADPVDLASHVAERREGRAEDREGAGGAPVLERIVEGAMHVEIDGLEAHGHRDVERGDERVEEIDAERALPRGAPRVPMRHTRARESRCRADLPR